jgi:hypothetical protein
VAGQGVVIRPAEEEHRYELAAVYRQYDLATGQVTSRDNVVGRFVRRPHHGGECADAFEWLWVKVGHASSREAPIDEWKDLEYARGFSYVMDMESAFDKFPVDVSAVPHDPEGWLFYIHLTEAHFQFDFLRTRRWGRADRLLNVGDAVVRESSVPWRLEDFRPFVVAQYDPSSCQNLTQWVAVTDYEGQPANVLHYRVDDARLEMELPLFGDLKNDGLVNYHGHIYVGRESGVLLSGSFFEYMPALTGYNQCVIHLKLID